MMKYFIGLMLSSLSFASYGAIQDSVEFHAHPMVIIWSQDSHTSHISNASIISTNTSNHATPPLGLLATSIIPLNGQNFPVMTGVIENTALDAPATLGNSFFVSSNCAFNLYAQSAEEISLSMTITQSGSQGGITFGSKAQLPTPGGSGFVAFPVTIQNVSTKIYGAGRKTAIEPGSLAEQSVRFDAQYHAIKQVSTPIVYNIYIP